MKKTIFNIFKVGVGPSSSHTTGPMIAAKQFADELTKIGLEQVDKIQVDLYGSLSLTGKGHGTAPAIISGLSGKEPKNIEPDFFRQVLNDFDTFSQINLADKKTISFSKNSIVFHQSFLKHHANGVDFSAFDKNNNLIHSLRAYSIGGGDVEYEKNGKIVTESEFNKQAKYEYKNAKDLLAICEKENITLTQLAKANEIDLHGADEFNQFIDSTLKAMMQSVVNGCNTSGILPGGLNVRRRAKGLYDKLREENYRALASDFDWLSLYAIAVNEENAAYGRIVTSPTNGAAGVIPSVLRYYLVKVKGYKVDELQAPFPAFEDAKTFLLVAGLIGILYKLNASVSAAEMGCQGEIGVASSMAAGAFAAVMGANNMQIENAAEIAMEHSLGMTCDPIKGLVQVPCIERNTMGAIKAVNSAKLAIFGDGKHIVSLDQVIATMKQTGIDMQSRYKETSLGGLAVNVVEC